GKIPSGIRMREQAFARSLPTRGVNAFKGSASQSESYVWQSYGPDNVGGRTRALAIDVTNENVLIAGAAMGGMWRSSDGGSSWSKTTLPGQLNDVTCAVQDVRPGKQHIWYAGTGELLSTTERRTSVVNGPRWRTTDIGDGIYKSVDRGKSWTVIPSTVSS